MIEVNFRNFDFIHYDESPFDRILPRGHREDKVGGESLDYYMVDHFGLGCGCRMLGLYEEICQRKSGLVYHLPAFH